MIHTRTQLDIQRAVRAFAHIAKIYRDVRAGQIYEGTSDIQRMVIAGELA